MQLFLPGTTKLQGDDLNMKTMKKMSLMVLALLLALSLSAAAFAEETEATATESAPVAAETAPAETKTAAADTQTEENALYDALAAYAKAKAEAQKQSFLDSLKEELNGYVTGGILTQEDADLILKYYAEQMTQTGNGFGRGGKGFPNSQRNPFDRNSQFGQNPQGNQQGGCGGKCLPNGQNNQFGQGNQFDRNNQFGQNPQGGFGMGGRHGQFNNTPSVPDTVTGATPNTAAPAAPNQNSFPAPGAFPGR